MSKANPKDKYYAVWATAWGPMGAVAGDAGVRRVVLPHYSFDDLLALLAWEHPGATRDEAPFARMVELSRDYFNAKPTDFADVVCELPGKGSFSGMVYRGCREIPYGQTRSYSRLAKELGREDAARAVATAMSKNPTPLVIPCHRVIHADGTCGGFSAPGGDALKRRMLDLEKKVIGN